MMWDGETPFLSDHGISRAFSDAQNTRAQYLAITKGTYYESALAAHSEDELLRRLRYEGLRPNGTPLTLVRLFNLALDFETQMAMPAEQTLKEHLSENAQHAYARYLAELERKHAPAAQKNGRKSPLKRL